MERLFDRLILMICCGVVLMVNNVNIYTSVTVIIAVTLVSVNIAFDYMKVHGAVYILYLLLTFFCRELIYFAPVICYDFFMESNMYISIGAVFIIFVRIKEMSYWTMAYIFFMLALAYILKRRTSGLLNGIKQAYYMRDEIKIKTERLAKKSSELMERQDYEIENATLNERNRIAREIHDTVGHIISSSLLQIGALLAITKNETEKMYLEQVKETLTEGMDSIRSSIHNIHEDSMKLESKIRELAKNYVFCRVNINYRINNDFTMKQKYTILFIVKEAMTNTMKHSDATAINMVFAEMPGFYKIIIEDNGTGKRSEMELNSEEIRESKKNMGLVGMYERVTELNGIINIEFREGCRIYITLPKNKK
ncbi:MAG: hypothetical protein K1W00_10420 [Lachnospiraceae bacterium]